MDNVTAENTREAIDVIHELSQLLDTGLDKETLTLSLALIQQGVHPEGLAKIIQELRGSSRNKTEDVPMDES